MPEWSAFKILTRKPAGKSLLVRPRRRWEENIRKDLEEIGINARDGRDYWRDLVNAALNLRVSSAMEIGQHLSEAVLSALVGISL